MTYTINNLLLHLIGELGVFDFVATSGSCITARLLLIADPPLPILTKLPSVCLCTLASFCDTNVTPSCTANHHQQDNAIVYSNCAL